MQIADRKCGMNVQAAVLLAALAEQEVDLPQVEVGRRIDGYVETYPYCNCREMGFCLQVHIGYSLKPMNMVFYEHRNCDNLCCIRWEGPTAINGSVSPNDIPREIFSRSTDYTKSWPYMSIREAMDYVREEIEAYAALAVASDKKARELKRQRLLT